MTLLDRFWSLTHDWNAMLGFHYLMRLGHLLNAISEFQKTIKRYVRELGCSPTLKLIKDTLLTPWLPENFCPPRSDLKPPTLQLQLE